MLTSAMMAGLLLPDVEPWLLPGPFFRLPASPAPRVPPAPAPNVAVCSLAGCTVVAMHRLLTAAAVAPHPCVRNACNPKARAYVGAAPAPTPVATDDDCGTKEQAHCERRDDCCSTRANADTALWLAIVR